MSNYTIFGAYAEGVAMFKGDGWGIDADHIMLNGIDAEFVYELEHRNISVKGPAVEDIFKFLRDLIKKNGALTEENERLAKENQELEKYIDEQEEEFNMEIKKRDGRVDCLNKMLQKEMFDETILRTRLDEKTENYDRLQDLYLKEINKSNTLHERIRELEEEKTNAAVTNYCMNDVVMTKKVYDTDITRMFPCTYSDAAKEVLGWIDGEMKNNTDYATKIFNKEDVGNIFSITFCKVPVKSEEDE